MTSVDLARLSYHIIIFIFHGMFLKVADKTFFDKNFVAAGKLCACVALPKPTVNETYQTFFSYQ